MITISNVIEQIISDSPFLEEYISKGLINISSLARELKPEIEKKLRKTVKDAAIVMALNRMSISTSQLHSKKIENILKQISDVTVRSSLANYSYKNSGSLRSCISKYMQEIENNNEVFFTLSQGIYESTIIINKSLIEDVNRVFKNETCVNIENDITAISIKLPKMNTEVKGVYYMIFKYFTNNNINIKDVVSTSNELTLLINSANAEKAFSTINKLRN